MAREYEPVAGQWYENIDENESFRVLSVDEDSELIEIEYLDGDIEEIDLDTLVRNWTWTRSIAARKAGPVPLRTTKTTTMRTRKMADKDDEDDEDDWDEDDDEDDEDWDEDDEENESYYLTLAWSGSS